MKRFLLGLLAGVALAAAAPLVAVKVGAVDPRVSAGPLPLERTLAAWAVSGGASAHAPKGAPIPLSNPSVIARGMTLYAQSCAPCHGAPGVPAAPFTRGLGPPPPDLARVAEARPPGEIFWITKHGIARSAMPAWEGLLTDEALWEIVAFVEHLPELTLAERVELTALAPHLRPTGPPAPGFGDDEAAQATAEAAPDPPAATPQPKPQPKPKPKPKPKAKPKPRRPRR